MSSADMSSQIPQEAPLGDHMFEGVLNTAKLIAALADATVSVAVKPVQDGAKFATEGLREIIKDDEVEDR